MSYANFVSLNRKAYAPSIIARFARNSSFKVLGQEEDKERINQLFSLLSLSETGAVLINHAKEQKYRFKMNKGMFEYGGANPYTKVVNLNPKYNNGRLVGTLAHELRHLMQYSSGAMPEINSLDFKSYMMQNRAMEADAEALGVLVSWELKKAGFPDSWNIYKKESPHLATAFENNINISKEKAMTETFKAWYDNKALIDTYDSFQVSDLENIDEYDDCKFDKKLSSANIIKMLCKDPVTEKKYFTEADSLLEEEKYITISDNNKKRAERFLNDEMLIEEYGVKDFSYKKLPVRDDARYKKAKKSSGKKTTNKRVDYSSDAIMIAQNKLLGR